MPKRLLCFCLIFGNLLFASSQILDINSSTNLNLALKNSQNSPNLDKNSSLNSKFDLNSTKNSQSFVSDLNVTQSDLNALKARLLNAKIYESAEFKTLLHYENDKSTINKKSNFFLSKDGYKDPKAEYIATIEKFFDELQNDFVAKNSKATQGLQDSLINSQNTRQTKQNLQNTNKKTQQSQANSQNTTQNPKNPQSLESSIRCLYPARLYFIAQNFSDETFSKLIDTDKCEGLNEFLQIVPLDELMLEFAAESTMYPGSAMGHIFLHLQGLVREDINKSINNAPFVRKRGDLQDYAMSYFAMMSEGFNPLDYVGALSGTLRGFYGLSPYDNAELDYLENEQRSLYVFKVRAKRAKMWLFLLHLWELKDKEIAYDFVRHNCTNGIESVLAVLDADFAHKGKKPFITPLEYIQRLEKSGKIELKEIKAPPNKEKFTHAYGHNEILKTRKASKIALGGTANGAFLYFAPIYSDIKNANNAYKELIESRLASVEVRVNGLWGARKLSGSSVNSGLNSSGGVNSGLNSSSGVNFNANSGSAGGLNATNSGLNSGLAGENSRKAKFLVHKIELLHLFSVADTFRTGSFSKLISIKFEPNLYQKVGKRAYSEAFNEDTRLFPTLDLGLGLGGYAGDFGFYALGDLGYRYEFIHNAYAGLKSGVVANFRRLRLLASYDLFYDFNDNNRGYDSQISLFAGLNAFKEVDIFAEFNAFHQLFNTNKIFYEKKQTVNFKVGVSVNF